MYYSPSTNGFYDPEINPNIPDDAIEISKQTYDDLIAGQASGLVIYFDGQEPALKEQRQPTYDEELKLINNSRSLAYRTEADPLFFKSQRGECSLDEWKEKVAEIKALYPKPVQN